jgi:hypothetical protein
LPKLGGQTSVEIQLYIRLFFGRLNAMNLKKFLPLLPLLLLVGCATANFTRMTPNVQPRNAENLYPVEVGFYSKQQSMRQDSIKAYVLVGSQPFQLRPVPLVQNRWEGLVPVPATANSATYRFKFDYLYNTFGSEPKTDSAWSRTYTLKIVNE